MSEFNSKSISVRAGLGVLIDPITIANLTLNHHRRPTSLGKADKSQIL